MDMVSETYSKFGAEFLKFAAEIKMFGGKNLMLRWIQMGYKYQGGVSRQFSMLLLASWNILNYSSLKH